MSFFYFMLSVDEQPRCWATTMLTPLQSCSTSCQHHEQEAHIVLLPSTAPKNPAGSEEQPHCWSSASLCVLNWVFRFYLVVYESLKICKSTISFEAFFSIICPAGSKNQCLTQFDWNKCKMDFVDLRLVMLKLDVFVLVSSFSAVILYLKLYIRTNILKR